VNKIYKIEDIPNHISGIYKINFPNGKSYIGLSNNIKRRIKEHNVHSKQEKGSPTKHAVHYAIEKYYQGSIPEIEVLEEIDFNDKDKMKEREKYWIAYYDTYGENGYNLTEGGDGLEMLRNLWKEN
jgi:group I intron endonuclease